MSQFRTYFYDLETRKEMTDYEHNGKQWLQVSGMIMKDGKFVERSCTFVRVARYASIDCIKGEATITANDFPGKRVAVKIWFSPTNVEWRELVKED